MVASDEPLVAAPKSGEIPNYCGGRCLNPLKHKVDTLEKWWQKCCVVFLFFAFWWFLFRGILQFICFHFATMGCSASALADYRYPGGGWTCPSGFVHPDRYEDWDSVMGDGAHQCKYNPRDNVVPAIALLLERPSTMLGKSFQVFPASVGTATIDQAQVGLWWRTWGPWFWTYTYQDMHSRTSIYMRPTLIGMMGLYSETRIMRCDGQGDVWFFGEGSNWVSNRIRTFFGNIFGMQREGSFKMYDNSEQYGTALEVFHGSVKSITFQRGEGTHQITLGSSVLTPNSDHPHSDMWSVHKNHDVNYRELPPYYVMSAATVLMAFRWISIRQGRGIPSGHQHPPDQDAPQFLAATSNASVTFFEEASETLDAVQDPKPLQDGDENADTEASEAVNE